MSNMFVEAYKEFYPRFNLKYLTILTNYNDIKFSHLFSHKGSPSGFYA